MYLSSTTSKEEQAEMITDQHLVMGKWRWGVRVCVTLPEGVIKNTVSEFVSKRHCHMTDNIWSIEVITASYFIGTKMHYYYSTLLGCELRDLESGGDLGEFGNFDCD